IDFTGWFVSGDRTLERVPLRRLPGSRAGIMAASVADGGETRAGPRRAYVRDPAHARGASGFRCERLAADRRRRTPTGPRRKLYSHRKSLPLQRGATAARTSAGRSVLERCSWKNDLGESLVRCEPARGSRDPQPEIVSYGSRNRPSATAPPLE